MAPSEQELHQQLSAVLPLGDDEVSQVLTQARSLPSGEASEYLSSLVGDSPEALRFISSFSESRSASANGEKAALAARDAASMPVAQHNPTSTQTSYPADVKAPPVHDHHDEKRGLDGPPAYAPPPGNPPAGGNPPAFAPPSSAPPASATSRARARHHTNQVIEAGKVRARDEVSWQGLQSTGES